jgi:uncharacterized protein
MKIYSYILTLIVVIVSTTIFAQNNTKSKKNCIISYSKNKKTKPMETSQKNVLGTDLKLASIDPMTGFFRTGYCATDENDRGVHVVAAVVTEDFLQYSLSKGNDLISPNPSSGFPGLKPGNVWCLCALRWKEALEAGHAPPVILEATNIRALDYVTLEELKSKKVE